MDDLNPIKEKRRQRTANPHFQPGTARPTSRSETNGLLNVVEVPVSQTAIGRVRHPSRAWAQPVVAFDLEGSVGQDSRRARDVDVSGSGGNLSWSGRGLAV